jgi:hypothetical protein
MTALFAAPLACPIPTMASFAEKNTLAAAVEHDTTKTRRENGVFVMKSSGTDNKELDDYFVSSSAICTVMELNHIGGALEHGASF